MLLHSSLEASKGLRRCSLPLVRVWVGGCGGGGGKAKDITRSRPRVRLKKLREDESSDSEVHLELKATGHSKDYYMHAGCAGAPACLYT